MQFATLLTVLFVFLLFAKSISLAMIVLAFVLVGFAGACLGYAYRAAIVKDLSAFQLGTIVSRLETAADKDLITMKAAASSVVIDLKKLL